MPNKPLLLQSGVRETSGQMQLYRKQGEESILLFLSEHRGTLRIQGKYHSLPPMSFFWMPFPDMHVSIQHSMPMQWAHIQLTDQIQQLLYENSTAISQIFSPVQPLSAIAVWNILLSADAADTEIQHHAAVLLFYMLKREAAASAEQAMRIPHYDMLMALRRDIYQNPAQDWNIQEICNDLCISRPYFHKIYAAAFDTSCTQDVIESRIRYAKTILEQTEDAISEIAQKCGFESDVYFMRQFKRRTGMTPTAYRRLCRQKI